MVQKNLPWALENSFDVVRQSWVQPPTAGPMAHPFHADTPSVDQSGLLSI